MVYGYIYKLELNQDLEDFKKGEFYVGKHNGVKKEYFGSGKIIKRILKKYSKEVFDRYIICEDINNDELLSYLERYYISFYNCNRSKSGIGLNLTDGGEGIFGYKYTEERRKEMSDRIKREYLENKRTSPKLKNVYQYCLETGKQLKTFSNCTEAGKTVNVGPSSIAYCARGEIFSVKGYSWSYKDLEYYQPSIYGKKAILQYDLKGNFIKEWKSGTDVTNELGFTNSSINNCCRNRSKTSHGFIWKYKEN